ncbi:glycosyltransferase family 1 protein, partial [Pseudomonas aeruginosa]|nr:glycosyltransferase family 1 protein [Pseudomonas aeruginosa]MDQ4346811.1 glycosyltransferase family 1 protein [Pseudomonas aeruginosa]
MSRPLSIALISETYPPEVNGVANTLGRLHAGLQQLGHRVQ